MMLMPSQVSWPDAREACRRFGGRLHIDRSEESVRTRTFPLIAKGEREFPDRCIRVWLGASDIKEEGVWRDSETDETLDISKFWVDGQPNGVRIQNCAGIWELVSKNKQDLKLLTRALVLFMHARVHKYDIKTTKEHALYASNTIWYWYIHICNIIRDRVPSPA